MSITREQAKELGFIELHSGMMYMLLHDEPVVLNRIIEVNKFGRDHPSKGYLMNGLRFTYYVRTVEELKTKLNIQ